MVVGCYSMHLYCDDPSAGRYVCTQWPGDFTGRTEAECLRTARAHGWRITRTQRVTCPHHRTARAKKDS